MKAFVNRYVFTIHVYLSRNTALSSPDYSLCYAIRLYSYENVSEKWNITRSHRYLYNERLKLFGKVNKLAVWNTSYTAKK